MIARTAVAIPASSLATPTVARSASFVIRRADVAAMSMPPLSVMLAAYGEAASRRRKPSTAYTTSSAPVLPP